MSRCYVGRHVSQVTCREYLWSQFIFCWLELPLRSCRPAELVVWLFLLRWGSSFIASFRLKYQFASVILSFASISTLLSSGAYFLRPMTWRISEIFCAPFISRNVSASSIFLSSYSLRQYWWKSFCSQQSTPQHTAEQDIAAMELIDSVTGVDEEGRSRQRILTYAARRFYCLCQRSIILHVLK